MRKAVDALAELGLHVSELLFEMMLDGRHAAVLQLSQCAQLTGVGGEGLLKHVAHAPQIAADCLQHSSATRCTLHD